jgi:hypothetical protein
LICRTTNFAESFYQLSTLGERKFRQYHLEAVIISLAVNARCKGQPIPMDSVAIATLAD